MPESVFKLPESFLTHCFLNLSILFRFLDQDMAAKRMTMRKIREVLRLRFSAELSIRQISAGTKISVGSIQNILKLAQQQGLSWPLPADLDDQALALLLYPISDARPSAKFQQPDWPEIHQELKRKGVTKQLLWDDCMDAGGRATQEQLPRSIPSSIRTAVTVIRSFAPVMPTG